MNEDRIPIKKQYSKTWILVNKYTNKQIHSI